MSIHSFVSEQRVLSIVHYEAVTISFLDECRKKKIKVQELQ